MGEIDNFFLFIIIDDKHLVIDNNKFKLIILGTDFYRESDSHMFVWTAERIIRHIYHSHSHHTMFIKVVQT